MNGYDNIFAIGDAAGVPDATAAWTLNGSAPLVAKNIIKLATAAANGATKAPVLAKGKEKGAHGVMMVPVGTKDGAAMTPLSILGKGMGSSVCQALGWRMRIH